MTDPFGWMEGQRSDDLGFFTVSGEWRPLHAPTTASLLYHSGSKGGLSWLDRSVTRGLDVILRSSTVLNSGVPYFPDEDASNLIVLAVGIPPNWDGSSDLGIRSWWFGDATGLVDLEVQTQSIADTVGSDLTSTTIAAFANNNITFSAANRYQAITTTVNHTALAAGMLVQIVFRRNTGDANTGNLMFQGARAALGTF